MERTATIVSRGPIFATASCVCGGMSIVAMQLATSYGDDLSLALCRSLFSMLPLLPILLLRHARPSFHDGLALFLLGSLVAGVSPWLLFMGLERAGSTMAGIIVSLGPLVTSVLAWATRQEAFSPLRWVGAAIAGSAVLLPILANYGHHSAGSYAFLAGTLLLLSGTVISGFYNVSCRNLLKRVTPLSASTFTVLGGFVSISILSFLNGNFLEFRFIPHDVILLLAISGIVGGPVKLQLWSVALKVTQASRVAVFSPVVSITAVSIDSIIKGSFPGINVLSAILLVIVGTSLVSRS
ncbi:DMT family transporter [Rhizobium mongolense]|uniref:DMT family transporter n=1 Tax=Rhizobium mongolense TaxID=57676 RepID=UPI0034A5273C